MVITLCSHVDLPKPVNVRISGRTNASLTVSWNYPPPPIGTVIRNFLVRSFALHVCISIYWCACQYEIGNGWTRSGLVPQAVSQAFHVEIQLL